MIFRSVSIVLLLHLVLGTASAQQPFQSERLNALLERRGWIRIGLDTIKGAGTIELPQGGAAIINGKSIAAPAGKLTVRSAGGKISIKISGQETLAANSLTLVPTGGIFSYSGRQYRGKAFFKAGSPVRLINEIMIDDWLKGVLPAEIGSDAPFEALKAQAVTGRSEAIFRLLVPPHASEGYDFCTGVHCQAYKGVSEENDAIRQACDATLGYVLVGNDDIINAVYHNVCGGVTAGAEDVWDSQPLPGLVPIYDKIRGGSVDLSTEAAARAFIEANGTDYFCYSGNPDYANYAKKYFRWQTRLDASQLGRMAGVGTLMAIEITERRPSGRVRKLKVSGTGGTRTYEKELNIRNVFDLWSGLFVMDVQQARGKVTSVTFTGAGNGHGVGLCQHGAREIARRGGTFDQILGHYYRGVKLKKIYRP